MAEWAYLIPKESKALVEIGFMPDDADAGTLRVRFRNDVNYYQAERVLTEHFVGLCCTRNRGAYYASVLKPCYLFVTVARIV